MPEIDRISGIQICVFSRDHLPPHFHAFYGEHEALIDIREGTVIVGGPATPEIARGIGISRRKHGRPFGNLLSVESDTKTVK